MALTDENNMVMPVTPMYGNGNGCGFGGDWSSWIILFLIFGMFGGWGNGFGGGYGGFGADGLYPWLNNSQNINGGFRDQMITSQIQGIQNGVTSGFGDVQTALCGGFAGVNASINGAQNAIAAQMYGNQIADLERSFAAQTANTQGLNALQGQLAQCCCDNRLATCQTQNAVQAEASATRFADANNTRDIIDSQTRGTQAILDKLCQLELDGVKQQVDAKNDRILDLQNQLNQAVFRESQASQNALFAQGMNNEVDALYNRLKNCPVGTTPVYGNQPIFTCGNNGGCGCGCGGV
jgi:hypothetical protein